jgi:salicylate hydroxylase
MNRHLLIAGGGIGGLAAALACARSGAHITLLEQAPEFSEALFRGTTFVLGRR